jgi:hypothetical protein
LIFFFPFYAPATNHFVPLLDGNLAGDDGRTAAVAIFEDLVDVSLLGLSED